MQLNALTVSCVQKKKQADMQSDNIEMKTIEEEQKYLEELKNKL